MAIRDVVETMMGVGVCATGRQVGSSSAASSLIELANQISCHLTACTRATKKQRRHFGGPSFPLYYNTLHSPYSSNISLSLTMLRNPVIRRGTLSFFFLCQLEA